MTDLDAMEAAARAATGGEWVLSEHNHATVSAENGGLWAEIRSHVTTISAANASNEANAAHIVATQPARVLPLIARVRELEAENKRLRAAVTVRWDGTAAYLGDQQIGCTTVLFDRQYAASSRLFSHTLMPYPTETEAKTALETAVSRALGLSE